MMVCSGGGKGERKNERIITSMSVNSGGQLVIVLVIVVIVGVMPRWRKCQGWWVLWQYSESWSIRVNAESIDYIKIINKFNIINI